MKATVDTRRPQMSAKHVAKMLNRDIKPIKIKSHIKFNPN